MKNESLIALTIVAGLILISFVIPHIVFFVIWQIKKRKQQKQEE